MHDLLRAWGDVSVTRPLTGGNRNTVLEVRRGGERMVVRKSGRPAGSLRWEIELLDYLAGQGLRVPRCLPALEGQRHVGPWVLQSWVQGEPPGAGDWAAVTAELENLHRLTAAWPQRPGFASTHELLTAERGGDVDLGAMPAAAVDACRAAWARLTGRPQAVVHGDPGPANIRVSRAGVGLLDWDEARVDCTDLDLAELPIAALPAGLLTQARAAATAWEAANGWLVEPAYARQQLALLLAGKSAFDSVAERGS